MHKSVNYIGNRSFRTEETTTTKPAVDEVQIQVAYCGICGTDLHVYQGHMDERVGHNRTIGHEVSGRVHAVGADVHDIQVGQKVALRPLISCGTCPACVTGHAHVCHSLVLIGLDTAGGFQEFLNVPAETLHVVDDAQSLEIAALTEPLAVACHDVRRARVNKGDDVHVIGSGPIGLLIALVARHAGGAVTISEPNSARADVARSLGFQTFDPADVDVAAQLKRATKDKGADVVFEVSGTQSGVDLMTACAATRARIVMVAIHACKAEVDLFQFFFRELELLGARVYEPEDFEGALNLLAAGDIPADQLITDVRDLDDLGAAFADLAGDPNSIKTLIKCSVAEDDA